MCVWGGGAGEEGGERRVMSSCCCTAAPIYTHSISCGPFALTHTFAHARLPVHSVAVCSNICRLLH